MAQIDELFDLMVARGASDLHLHEDQPAKIRLHGEIMPITAEPLDRPRMASLLAEVAGPALWQAFQETGDLDFAYERDASARFRTNYMRHVHGIGAMFRLIPTKIRTLDDLGIPAVVRQFAELRGGIVLVTGPTGSGKSTTLAALIDHLNVHLARHVVTIEQPIEFVHRNKKSLITQREVPTSTPSFQTGLRAAMREDADAILVGEMRDLETMALALTAAETGVLVLGTLHTNSARKTVDRIIDVFPSEQQPLVRTMLASSLRGVVAQLLLKKADGTGRIAANEILIATTAVASIIREGQTEKLQDVLVGGRAEGMQSMDDSIMALLEAGTVTREEAYLKAIDKVRFEEPHAAH